MHGDGMGWSGDVSQMLYALDTFGCDRDADGNRLVAGTIALFMGIGPDVVVGTDAVYLRNGVRLPLAAALHATSYGHAAAVI